MLQAHCLFLVVDSTLVLVSVLQSHCLVLFMSRTLELVSGTLGHCLVLVVSRTMVFILGASGPLFGSSCEKEIGVGFRGLKLTVWFSL